MPIRYTARVEPTKHVMDMVAFAEAVLREAQTRGLKVTQRRRRHRKRRKTKYSGKRAGLAAKQPKAKGNGKAHPLAEATE